MLEEKNKSKSILNKVNKIMQEIEESKRERDIYIGRKEESMAQLKREFGINSIEDAEDKIHAIEEQINRRSIVIEKLFEDLSEFYKV